MIKRRYFINGIVYDNAGVERFLHGVYTHQSWFENPRKICDDFWEKLEVMAKENNCQEKQIKAFSRV